MKYLLMALMVLGSVTQAQADESETELAREKRLSAEYLERMAKEPGAELLEGGVVLRPIFRSDSESFPAATDTVKVSYHLADREGILIEESLTSDETVDFPLERLIRCWQVALPKIPKNSLYKVSCPSDTAYGDSGAGEGAIRGGAALTFRIHLYGFSARTVE